MTVYVDELRNYEPHGEWCHMWADTEIELHEFAKRLGLRRTWVHLSKGTIGDFVHYDLRPRKRDLALKYGAIFKPLKQHIADKQDGYDA